MTSFDAIVIGGGHNGLVAAATLAKAEPRVVCGMTVVQGDSTVDAHILRVVPQVNGKPAIRTVHPPACRQ